MNKKITWLIAGFALMPSLAFSHGDVAPQAVDTSGLPELGEEWLDENPWRDPENEYFRRALEVGSTGYNSNCARCHGLGAISGGTAPDVRYLSADMDGDDWFKERFRKGYSQGGVTKMPAFDELLGQDAGWAIRTYIETRPDDGAMDDYSPRLKEIHDELVAKVAEIEGGADAASFSGDVEGYVSELTEINSQVETGSGAPFAVSFAQTAAWHLEDKPEDLKGAAEILEVGLPAAH